MPHLVIWTDNALNGLKRLFAFLEEQSQDAAVNAIKAIREKALLLESFPNAGRPALDFDPEYRELIVPFGAAGYVLVYEVHAEQVWILAIKHQKEAGY